MILIFSDLGSGNEKQGVLLDPLWGTYPYRPDILNA